MSGFEMLVALKDLCERCLPAFDYTPPKRGGLLIDMGESDLIAIINRVKEVEELVRTTPANFAITVNFVNVSATYAARVLYLPMMLIKGEAVTIDAKLREELDAIVRNLSVVVLDFVMQHSSEDVDHLPSKNSRVIELAAQTAAISQIVKNSIDELSGQRTEESIVLVEQLSLSELPRYPELGMEELINYEATSLHSEAATIGPLGAFCNWCLYSSELLESSINQDHLATGYGLDDSQLMDMLRDELRRSLGLLTVGLHLAKKILASPSGDELVERLTRLHGLLTQSVRLQLQG